MHILGEHRFEMDLSTLFERISEVAADNLATWLDYWSQITLHPRRYAETFNLSVSAAFRLYVLNAIIGLFVFLSLACLYWAYFFTARFSKGWGAYESAVTLATTGPVFFAVASSLIIILPSLLAWLLFQWSHGSGRLSGHVARALVCSNFEWLLAIFYAIGLLLHDLDRSSYGGYGILPDSVYNAAFIVALSGLLLVRIYYALLQWKLLSVYHYKTATTVRSLPPLLISFAINIVLGLGYLLLYFLWLNVMMGVYD